MPRLAFGAEKDTIRNMKTPSRFPCFALLAAASLAFCFQAPLCAEEKPAPTTQEKKLTAEDYQQLNKAAAAAFEVRKPSVKAKYAVDEQERRAVLAVRERVFGAEHPETLSMRNSVASALSLQGKHAEAEKEHHAVLAIQERVLGAEHPDVLQSCTSLAHCLYNQKKLTAEDNEQLKKAAAATFEAKKLSVKAKYAVDEQERRAVLAVRERVFGAEHPETLKIRNSLASALSLQGKHAEAEQEYRAVLAIQERVLGAEHPDVLQSCASLALCLYFQKKLPEALAFLQRAETGYAKVPGPEHPYSNLTKGTRMLIEMAMRKP